MITPATEMLKKLHRMKNSHLIAARSPVSLQ